MRTWHAQRTGSRLVDASGTLVIGILAAWFLSLLWSLRSGLPALEWPYLIAEPLDAGRAGGIGPILVSTFAQIAIALGFATPLALLAGFHLSEWRDRSLLARTASRSLDILAAVPSVVFGLVGNRLFVHGLELGYSLLAGALTLSVMILPLYARMSQQAFDAFPEHQRRAGLALSLGTATRLFRLQLPFAWPSLATGALLACGRALSETAALLFTSGYAVRMPESVLDSGRTLSVHIHELAMNVPGSGEHASAATLALLGILALVAGVAGIFLRKDRP